MYSIGFCIGDSDSSLNEFRQSLEMGFKSINESSESILQFVKSHNSPVLFFYSYGKHSLKKPVCIENETQIFMINGYARERSTGKPITSSTVSPDSLDGKDLEGEFVFITLNKNSGEVKISNDRFAAVPFFVSKNKTNIIGSSNFHLLKIANKSNLNTNELGVYQMLKYTHTLGEVTTYSNIEKLFPATTISLDKHLQQSKNTYWNLQFKPSNSLSLNIFTDNVFEAFKEAVKWREGFFSNYSRLNVALSGGLDSRLLVGAMTPSKKNQTFTLGKSFEVEVEVARAISSMLNIEHSSFELENIALSELLSDVLIENGGLCPHFSIATNNSAYQFLGKGSHVIFGGWPGDVLIGSYVPNDLDYFSPRKKNKLIKRFQNFRGISPELLQLILKSNKLRELENLNSKYMEKCFNSLGGPTAAHDISAWAMIYRQPSFSFLSPSHSAINISEVTPCLGYEFNDLLLQIPGEYIYKKNFYKYLIFKKLKSLRMVKYANTGEYLTGKFELTNLSLKSQIKKQIKNFVPEKVFKQIQEKRRKSAKQISPYWSYVNEKKLMEYSLELLAESNLGKEILDKDKTVKFFRAFSNGELQDSHMTNLAGSIQTLLVENKFVNTQKLFI